MSVCKYGDPLCPCQDGDMCHYEGKNPMLTVTAKCIGCGHKREIAAGAVGKDDVPMCDKCFMPMVAVRATRKSKLSAALAKPEEA